VHVASPFSTGVVRLAAGVAVNFSRQSARPRVCCSRKIIPGMPRGWAAPARKSPKRCVPGALAPLGCRFLGDCRWSAGVRT
jgi:hypothetical protein